MVRPTSKNSNESVKSAFERIVAATLRASAGSEMKNENARPSGPRPPSTGLGELMPRSLGKVRHSRSTVAPSPAMVNVRWEATRGQYRLRWPSARLFVGQLLNMLRAQWPEEARTEKEWSMSTEMTYLEDTYRFEDIARITRVEVVDGTWLEFDRTIFYPQGGGQPTDKGYVESTSGRFRVDKVELVDGTIRHRGNFDSGAFVLGEQVSLLVHGPTRLANARMHSGGHLIMTAMDTLRAMKAIKGYHFPDGPYVEFLGAVPELERPDLVVALQKELDRLVDSALDVEAVLTSLQALEDEGIYIPMEIPKDKPTRVVTTGGYRSPCGGTHVKSTDDLRGIVVKGLKSKSGNTRVSYTMEQRSV